MNAGGTRETKLRASDGQSCCRQNQQDLTFGCVLVKLRLSLTGYFPRDVRLAADSGVRTSTLGWLQ